MGRPYCPSFVPLKCLLLGLSSGPSGGVVLSEDAGIHLDPVPPVLDDAIVVD